MSSRNGKECDYVSFENIELIHRQIVIDLTIRTLEHDRKHLSHFKMSRAFEMWFDLKIMELHADLKKVKLELGKRGAKVQSHKVEGDFTIFTVVEKGVVSNKNYMNIALKNWCEEETKRLLGLEYRTMNDVK